MHDMPKVLRSPLGVLHNQEMSTLHPAMLLQSSCRTSLLLTGIRYYTQPAPSSLHMSNQILITAPLEESPETTSQL